MVFWRNERLKEGGCNGGQRGGFMTVVRQEEKFTLKASLALAFNLKQSMFYVFLFFFPVSSFSTVVKPETRWGEGQRDPVKKDTVKKKRYSIS